MQSIKKKKIQGFIKIHQKKKNINKDYRINPFDRKLDFLLLTNIRYRISKQYIECKEELFRNYVIQACQHNYY